MKSSIDIRAMARDRSSLDGWGVSAIITLLLALGSLGLFVCMQWWVRSHNLDLYLVDNGKLVPILDSQTHMQLYLVLGLASMYGLFVCTWLLVRHRRDLRVMRELAQMIEIHQAGQTGSPAGSAGR